MYVAVGMGMLRLHETEHMRLWHIVTHLQLGDIYKTV